MAKPANERWVPAVFIGIFLIVMPRTECYWERLGGIPVAVIELLIVAAFLLAIVKLVASIRFAIRNWSQPKWVATRPALVYLAILFFAALDVPGLDCKVYQSPVVTRACYEGTMVTRGILLRANGVFEERSSSYGRRELRPGAWRWDGDTLRLTFSGEPLVKRYLRKADTLFAIADGAEKSYPPWFLEGWCRREN